jgi:acetoin utilization deacetylase AcuC-like enzyme
MQAFYSDHFVLPLPAGHRFPMAKYRLLRERVESELTGVALREPLPASDGELALAHDPHYVARVLRGDLTAQEQRVVGFPWSEALVARARRTTGGTIAACRTAMAEQVAVNLAGGTHHAHADHGQGYCTFNDAAVAARLMQAEAGRRRALLRVAIVDLDVHQGNGTAAILCNDVGVFTLSLHGERNFPFRKEHSTLDVALPDGTTDDAYLAALDVALESVLRAMVPQLVIYLAGADAHEDDRLGKLSLTTAGMRERDQHVLAFARRCDAAIAICMAGGYGRSTETTVDVHFNTVESALRSWRDRQNMAIDGARIRIA